jgi:hypothetical protein
VKKILAFALVFTLLALLYIFIRKKMEKRDWAKPYAGSVPVGDSSNEASLQFPESPTAPSHSQQAQTRSQKLAAQMRQLGLKNLPFKKNEIWELKINFTSTIKRCELGDMDLIRIDQRRRNISSLALSLDDLGSHKNLFFQKINLEALKNSPLVLRWKADSEPRSLGLYICSDSRNARSCAKAEVVDINQALAIKDPLAAADRVYFFQYIQEAQQLALMDSSRPQAGNGEGLSQLLTDQGASPEEAKRISTRVSQANMVIGSMAAAVEKDGLQIDLPQNDPACRLPQLEF